MSAWTASRSSGESLAICSSSQQLLFFVTMLQTEYALNRIACQSKAESGSTAHRA